jgi:hypothetical protein
MAKKPQRMSTPKAATLLGVCHQRLSALLKQGRFPNATPCECGRSIMIPVTDMQAEIKRRSQRGKK